VTNITTVGIDLAKSLFQVHGVDERGKAVLRKALKRTDVMNFFAKLLPCLLGDGSLWQRSFLGAQAHRARSHGQADGTAVREVVREEQQERCAGCGSDLRGRCST
jgi:transposase